MDSLMAKVCFTLRANRRSSRGRARERLQVTAGELEGGERSSSLAGNSTGQETAQPGSETVTSQVLQNTKTTVLTAATHTLHLPSAFGNGLNLFLTEAKLTGRTVAGWPFLVFLSAHQRIEHNHVQLVPLTTRLQENRSYLHWVYGWLCDSFLRIWLQKEDFPDKWHLCAG